MLQSGWIPITKNIYVTDELKKDYEPTYLRRAKGLVKNGRAHWVDENKICLECPPNIFLEDKIMSEINNISNDSIGEIGEMSVPATEPKEEKLSMNYVLEQIEKIASQTEYLNNAINKLGLMADGDNAETYSPGNTLGQAKAEAIGDVVRCRETTNQQLLKLYEKMYDDLKPQKSKSSEDIAVMNRIIDSVCDLPPNESSAVLREQLARMF